MSKEKKFEKNETPEKAEPTFQQLVRQERERTGCSLTAAMQAVSGKHPEAHAAFLQSGSTLDASPEDAGEKDFMTMVEQCQTMRKCSRTEAMQRIARSHPNAHRQFIEQANRREE
ncbi:hypothetical protein [Desulfosarcina ovata]|uniref:Uncharacterized protein n=1 Tax=Desulfosarcina ovata subsp. ovata TaxID=2752305 RepID=A0A5K8A6U0_9BACT|nr:hypothetical protein [Desulfosarcina ovata]BBO88191.1 hypothetical protein DSCOOX_13710 [Desulfosarcina ovata subsp. ovata]